MVFTPFDAAAAPPSGVRHVAVSGIAQTGMIVTLEHTGTGDKRTETYLPLTPPQWRQGDPVTYFMLPRINAYSIGSQYAMIESRTRPFPMTLKGSLFSNGLPGLVRAEYEKSGLKLAPTTYLIDGKADADLEIYFGLAFAGVLLGLVLLLSAGIIKFKQRRAKPA